MKMSYKHALIWRNAHPPNNKEWMHLHFHKLLCDVSRLYNMISLMRHIILQLVVTTTFMKYVYAEMYGLIVWFVCHFTHSLSRQMEIHLHCILAKEWGKQSQAMRMRIGRNEKKGVRSKYPKIGASTRCIDFRHSLGFICRIYFHIASNDKYHDEKIHETELIGNRIKSNSHTEYSNNHFLPSKLTNANLRYLNKT